jgi:hypothetical protein
MAAFLEHGLAVGAMNPQTNGNTSVNIDEPLALVVEVVRNSSSLSDTEAGLVNGSPSNDFQNRLTSSKKEL